MSIRVDDERYVTDVRRVQLQEQTQESCGKSKDGRTETSMIKSTGTYGCQWKDGQISDMQEIPVRV